jgi:hypothetical protein
MKVNHFILSSLVAAVPSPFEVKFKNLTFAGSGCTGDGAILDLDQNTYSLLFSNFKASTGAGISAVNMRKNCQVNFEVQHPKGWSFAISFVPTTGYVSVPANTTAVHKNTIYFSGRPDQSSFELRTEGPYEGEVSNDGVIPDDELVYSSCQSQNLVNINTQTRLEGNFRNEANSTIDFSGTGYFALKWKKCSASSL